MQEAKVAAASWVHLYFSGHTVHDISPDYLDCYENLPTAVSVMKAGNPQKENYILRGTVFYFLIELVFLTWDADRTIYEELYFLLCFNYVFSNLSYCKTFFKIYNILIVYNGYEMSHQAFFFSTFIFWTYLQHGKSIIIVRTLLLPKENR